MKYLVRIRSCENKQAWCAKKIGLIFWAHYWDHHVHYEKRKIYIGIRPEHGWIFEDEVTLLFRWPLFESKYL